MHEDLVQRIRKRLLINPLSKSTLVKKEELLQYASLLCDENQLLKESLNPQMSGNIFQLEQRLKEENTKLKIYEQYFKEEHEKNEQLKCSLEQYSLFLQNNIQKQRKLGQSIEELNLLIKQEEEKRKKMELSSFERLVVEQEAPEQGHQAMVDLMKQFLHFSKEEPEK